MISEAKAFVLSQLAATGIPAGDCFGSPRGGTKHRACPKAWIDANAEDATRNKRLSGTYKDGDQVKLRRQYFTRELYLVVRLEDIDLATLEARYEDFLRRLVKTHVHDAMDNHIHVTVGRVEWYEPEKVASDEAGVSVVLQFDGGIYEDEDALKVSQVEVAPDGLHAKEDL